MNSAGSLDRDVLSYLDDLATVVQLRGPKPKVFWADGEGSFTHPTAGIGLDRQRLASMAAAIPGAQFQQVIAFVLAHEFAHALQFGKYRIEEMSADEKTRPIEAQADVMAGLFVTWISLKRGIPPQQNVANINNWFQLAYSIGSPQWEDNTKHPRPEQRARAATLGLLAALQWADIDLYKRTQDPAALARIRDALSRNPDLPDLEDDQWEWANAVAKRITRFQQ